MSGGPAFFALPGAHFDALCIRRCIQSMKYHLARKKGKRAMFRLEDRVLDVGRRRTLPRGCFRVIIHQYFSANSFYNLDSRTTIRELDHLSIDDGNRIEDKCHCILARTSIVTPES